MVTRYYMNRRPKQNMISYVYIRFGSHKITVISYRNIIANIHIFPTCNIHIHSKIDFITTHIYHFSFDRI